MMRIIDAQIGMASYHAHTQRHEREERLLTWRGDPPPAGGSAPRTDQLILSAEATKVLAEHQAARTKSAAAVDESVREALSEEDRLKILLLERILGIRVRVTVLVPGRGEAPQGSAEPQRHGWGLEYDLHEVYHESERLSVAMAGVIRTADGKEIQFSVQVHMSRSVHWERHLSIRAGDQRIVDPLVINFNGTLADLSDRHYAFDLDSDGTPDQIPWLRSGSGFLALDRNGNGVIDDGSELFGPATGDGFAELAQYDADGNGWIDEGDPIYHQLRIWVKDTSGQDRLFALGQLGVGAIYVGSVAAPYTYTDGANQALGLNRGFGLYLKQNGQVGTVQQIDLVAK